MTAKRALLIGVDYYAKPANGKVRNVEFGDLSACVRDVLAFERYFRDQLKVTDIVKLISPLDKSTAPNDLPTHPNIIREIRRMEQDGADGDLVYIHYSGHGIRRDNRTPEDGGDNLSGTALVPMDVMQGGAYLTGYQLGVYVRRLVQKGMRVAISLDCCFSGRALRTEATGIRTSKSPYDNIFLPSDVEAGVEAAILDDTFTEDGTTAYRNCEARLSWVVDPDHCSVLTACDVKQFAQEDYFVERKESMGVLTHFVLQRLQRSSTTQLPSYERLAEYVTRKCAELGYKQRPVLHGEGDIEFFSDRPVFQKSVCHVYPVNGLFGANIGSTCGVAVGAQYEITQSTSSGTHASASDNILRVLSVSDYASTMEFINGSVQSLLASGGSLEASLKTWALPQTSFIMIQFSPQEPRAGTMAELLKQYLSEIPNLALASQGTIPSLVVSQDHNGTFYINQASQPLLKFDASQSRDEGSRIAPGLSYDLQQLHGVPQVQSNDPDAIEKLEYILQHLTRYQAIKNGSYRGSRRSLSPTAFKFEMTTNDSSAWPSITDGTYVVNHGDEVIFEFASLNPTHSAHVAIFSLNPSWGIMKLYPAGAQPMEALNGLESIKVEVTMEIPVHLEYRPILDIIRAYVYVGENPPNWNELVLPDLPADSRKLKEGFLFESVELDSETTTFRHPRPKKQNSKAGTSAMEDDVWTSIDIRVQTFDNQA